MTGIGGHHRGYRGRTDDWCTPPYILDALGPFDDDPCPIGGTDGHVREWHGFVWLNPPYGPKTGIFLRRMAEHNNGIALIFARTETEMFFRYGWDRASCMLFLRGRLHFYTTDGQRAKQNAGGPSVLIGYGQEAYRRLRGVKIPGHFVKVTD